MAGRRVIYIQNPSSGSHFRVLGSGGGNQPPLNKPAKPPKPPKVPSAPTHHGAGVPLTGGAGTGGGMPQYSVVGQALGIGAIAIGIEAGGPVGAGLIAAGLLGGYTLPMLPGWGQPLSFFSVLNTQNGATQGYQGNLGAVWAQIMEGLGTPTEGTIFDDFSLIKTEFGGSNQGISSEDYYYGVAKNAGIEAPPMLKYNWLGGQTVTSIVSRAIWLNNHGYQQTPLRKKDGSYIGATFGKGGSLFSP